MAAARPPVPPTGVVPRLRGLAPAGGPRPAATGPGRTPAPTPLAGPHVEAIHPPLTIRDEHRATGDGGGRLTAEVAAHLLPPPDLPRSRRERSHGSVAEADHHGVPGDRRR